jgi:hypothetical protein
LISNESNKSEEEERQQQQEEEEEEEEEVKLMQLTKGGDTNRNKIAKESGTSKARCQRRKRKKSKKSKNCTNFFRKRRKRWLRHGNAKDSRTLVPITQSTTAATATKMLLKKVVYNRF